MILDNDRVDTRAGISGGRISRRKALGYGGVALALAVMVAGRDRLAQTP